MMRTKGSKDLKPRVRRTKKEIELDRRNYIKTIELDIEESKGITFEDLLTVAFISLKLANQINWSWIWVVSPLWISFALHTLHYILEKISNKIEADAKE